jgi:hypothetical protein
MDADIADFPNVFQKKSFRLAQRELKPEGWRLQSPMILRLLEKLKQQRKPLGEHGRGLIYFGIKTGLNEAFILERATRDRLLREHRSSSALLTPFLRGRDVKRWRIDYADLYLLKIESSENKTHPWSQQSEREAEAVFARTYPAIHAHLDTFRNALKNRDDQGRFFWELRSCVYWHEFEGTKVLYPDIYEHQSVTWDERGYFAANTCYFIPTKEKWLTALLNSQAVEWFYSNVSNKIRGGYMRSFTDYMRQIPVPAASETERTALEALMSCIVKANEANPAADVSAVEREIDERVYRLYGMTPEEIKIVEDSVK